jgi:hypothetical protein
LFGGKKSVKRAVVY